ncbi:MAG: PIN domain-containing protein [Acidimicrobiales bacterium]|nr:MAG: PIN domain-containing protein [Acidimicrobiales bacterium]
MIYLDSCALLKFVKREKETDSLHAWREQLLQGTELVTSELAGLEISRTLLRAGVDYQRVPYAAGQALRGVYQADITNTVLAKARTYRVPKLGSLDAIHLATADSFRSELIEFITYDVELAEAAAELGFSVKAPA